MYASYSQSSEIYHPRSVRTMHYNLFKLNKEKKNGGIDPQAVGGDSYSYFLSYGQE